MIAVKNIIPLIFVITGFQTKNVVYYISDKGIYITIERYSKKTKIPYKENSYFYFSVKNDSTALIQNIYDNKSQGIREYKICDNFDSTYVKEYVIINGTRNAKTRKVVFRKVY